MALTARIVKGDGKGKHGKLVLEIDLQEPTRSSSGKTMVVASTHGNKETEAAIDGCPIIVGLNAYFRPQE